MSEIEDLLGGEGLFELVFNELREAIYISTLEGQILAVNPAMEKMFGYDSSELLSMQAKELYWEPEKREDFRQLIAKGDYVQDYEVEFRTKGDEKIHCLNTAVQKTLLDGRLVYVGIVRQVNGSESPASENGYLLIGRGTAQIVHDLKNVFSVITAYSELHSQGVAKIQEEIRRLATNGSGDISEDLGLLVEGCQRNEELLSGTREKALLGSDIVRRILDLVNKKKIELTEMCLSGFVERYSPGFLAPSILSAGYTLKTELSSEYKIMGDVTVLYEILQNIVINARDAMPEGGNITISTRDEDLSQPLHAKQGIIPTGSYSVIGIRDQGKGIKETDIDKVFLPLYSTKRGNGHGFGLSMVWTGVKSLNGYISVDSKRGEGTLFEIYFPAVIN